MARQSGLSVGRRAQMSAVQPRGLAGVPAVHEGGLQNSGSADAAGHQRSDMVHPLRATGPGNRRCSERYPRRCRTDLR